MAVRTTRPVWALVAIMCLIGSSGTTAGTLADYRLLVLGGGPVKWGSPSAGTGSVVTYAVADARQTVPGAINCGEIAPLDTLLARSGIPSDRFERELARAFQAWADVANIAFVRTDAAKADIVIGAQATPTGRAFTNVAHGPAARNGMGTILSSIICLNPEQRWKIGFDRDLEVYDLRYTLMHEIGHAIGLDHPGTPEAVMDFRYREAFSQLQAGDRAGAVALYGPPRPVAARTAQLREPAERGSEGRPTRNERAFGAPTLP